MGFSGITGKVALVTGAAQGIGAAVVQMLAEQGAIVAAVDCNTFKLEQVVTQWNHNDLQVKAFSLDIGDSTAVQSTVQQIEQSLGAIDILVNVAGILRPASIATLSDDDWAATFNVNLNGLFYVSRAVVTYMAARNRGAIVTVGSNAAGVPRIDMAAYASSKAAAAMFTKCLALEYAKHHIRCNVVAPGSTDTDMQRMLWQDEHGAEQVIQGSLSTFKNGIPLGKIASPSDIADAVLFLVSDQAQHITMQELYIDGGATLGV